MLKSIHTNLMWPNRILLIKNSEACLILIVFFGLIVLHVIEENNVESKNVIKFMYI